MEKITAEFIAQFIATNNIPFVPTQSKLSIPIIARICRKMSHDIRFDEIKTCGKLVIDGHHRYLSSLIMKFEIGTVRTNTTSGTKETPWAQIEFDENDGDTPAKINYLNEQDAKYNNLTVEFLTGITSNN